MKRTPIVLALAAAATGAFVSLPADAAPGDPVPVPAVCGTRDARTFSDVALRTAPEASSSMIEVVPANSFVSMAPEQAPVADATSWIAVDVNGRRGYLTSKYAEGPWLTKRVCGDTAVHTVPAGLVAKIVAEGL